MSTLSSPTWTLKSSRFTFMAKIYCIVCDFEIAGQWWVQNRRRNFSCFFCWSNHPAQDSFQHSKFEQSDQLGDLICNKIYVMTHKICINLSYKCYTNIFRNWSFMMFSYWTINQKCCWKLWWSLVILSCTHKRSIDSLYESFNFSFI